MYASDSDNLLRVSSSCNNSSICFFHGYAHHRDLHVLTTLFPYTTLFRSSTIARHWKRASSSRSAATASTSVAPAPPRSVANCTINRSEEHTSELQSLMRISYAVFCLKKKK